MMPVAWVLLVMVFAGVGVFRNYRYCYCGRFWHRAFVVAATLPFPRKAGPTCAHQFMNNLY